MFYYSLLKYFKVRLPCWSLLHEEINELTQAVEAEAFSRFREADDT